MSEVLLEKEDSSSEISQKITIKETSQTDEYGSSKSNLFEFDIISDTLRHIYSKSKLRKKLSSTLSTFYAFPILIILFSFLIGLSLFGLSMLFIYFKIFTNIMKPIIFIILISLLFSISLIIIRLRDDVKNKMNYGAKWERKNILKNIGLSLTLIVLTIAAFFFHSFFNKLETYYEKEDIKFDYEEDNDGNNISFNYDFLLFYIIKCFIINENDIEDDSKKVKINYGDLLLKQLHKSLLIASIPLIIFLFTKILKTILIEVKYTIPKIIVFINSFFLIILVFISHRFYNNEEFNWFIISLIEIVLLSLIYIGYILWIINSVYKLNKNPKDKNFAIYKYDLQQLLILFVFDLINIVGSSFMYISFSLNFLSYAHKEESYKDILRTLLFLKIGFLLCTISNSYYYGHHLLSLIFRPIALQYAPTKLKKFYIRATKNLASLDFY